MVHRTGGLLVSRVPTPALPSAPCPLPPLLLCLALQFLTLCLLVRPVSYTDASILDLMELLCRAGLDVGLCLLPKTDLQQLLLLLLERIQEWPGKVHSPWSTLGGESITYSFCRGPWPS